MCFGTAYRFLIELEVTLKSMTHSFVSAARICIEFDWFTRLSLTGLRLSIVISLVLVFFRKTAAVNFKTFKSKLITFPRSNLSTTHLNTSVWS